MADWEDLHLWEEPEPCRHGRVDQCPFCTYPGDLYDGNPPSQNDDTSTAAAASVKVVAGTMRWDVLEAIKATPSTDEELCDRLNMSPNTLRPRRRELELGGFIRDSGERRLTHSGRKAKVWTANQEGMNS